MLSLMPKAKGVALSKFMKDYKKDPSEKNLQQAAFAYENVGEKLSSFHKQFMRAGQFLGTTALHGDFHHGNVFVDDNGDVYFIDNERMANSFANPHDISNDVDYLFYITLGTLVTPPEFYNGFNTNLWIETILKSFIIGYLKPYEENERLPVLNGLEDRFKNSGKYLNIKLYGNFGQYAKYKTPIDEAFNELYKIYGGDAA